MRFLDVAVWGVRGTSHVVLEDEAKFVFEKGAELLVLGSGQAENVRLSPEVRAARSMRASHTGCAVSAALDVSRAETRGILLPELPHVRNVFMRASSRRGAALVTVVAVLPAV
jgi:hypothetical protein